MTLPVLAEVVRSGFVESRHRGSAVVLAPDGATVYSAGRPDEPVLPRSANKPLQAVGLLRAGWRPVREEHLAVACGSHHGEERHAALAVEVLTAAGLDETALRCTPDLPYGPAETERVLRAGGGPTRLQSACSGKHAAMLATAVTAGWSTEGYTEPDHPVQRACGAAVVHLAGAPVSATAVDGCGAVAHAVPLSGVARGYAQLVQAAPGSDERRVADAMAGHPWAVGGAAHPGTALMAAVPGSIAKEGADGTFVVALADGTAVAVTVEDGADRARLPVLYALLARVGVRVDLPPVVVLGGGEPVGEVRAVLP